jgi:uncharacterized protein (TIGR02466 family)
MKENFEILNLNAIPIYKEKTTFSLTKEELFFLINDLKCKTFKDKPGFFLSENSYILNKKELKRIKTFLNEKANFYKNKIMEIKDNIGLTQSWLTINKKNSFHHIHKHPNTFISVVYYINSMNGILHFDINQSPLEKGFNFEYKIKNYNIYNSSSWNLPVNTGDIVIFPGWINHRSSPNNQNQDKILIGSNYFLTGVLGNINNYSQIKIS